VRCLQEVFGQMVNATCTYCIRRGFPELDDMCHQHYRWLVCNSLRHGADLAEQEWSAAIDRVYKVEVQLGLRPSPYEPTLSGDNERGTELTPRRLQYGKRSLSERRSPDQDEDFI
jgi:hypothetical protein